MTFPVVMCFAMMKLLYISIFLWIFGEGNIVRALGRSSHQQSFNKN